jgi:SHS2 domain-containing protein
MTEGSWNHVEHEADIGVCGRGPDVASAFAQAGLALTAIITEVDKVEAKNSLTVHCQAPNLELLFTEWLNELIYLMSTEKMLFSQFQVNISGNTLQATIHGENVDLQRHEPAVEIKGATFTGLKVEQREDGSWQACTVVDV